MADKEIQRVEVTKVSYFEQEKPDWRMSVPLWLAGGTAGGAALGRYILAPILSRVLGLDKDRSRSTLTALGALSGAVPGLLLGSARKGTYGKFFHPGGSPRDFDETMHFNKALLGPSRPSLDKSGSSDPGVYGPAFWQPTFPVAQNLDEIARNPNIPLSQKVQMRQLVAQAGQEQGVGHTGLASAGALAYALPQVVRDAVPTVGGAWAASKLLGAPKGLRRTAIGGALVYSALKSFMKGAEYKTQKYKTPRTTRYSIDYNGKSVGSSFATPGADGKILVHNVNVSKDHRGRGLAKRMLSLITGDHKGKILKLEVDAYNDKPLNNDQLKNLYTSCGFKPTGKGSEMEKAASQAILRGMEGLSHIPWRDIGKAVSTSMRSPLIQTAVGAVGGAGLSTAHLKALSNMSDNYQYSPETRLGVLGGGALAGAMAMNPRVRNSLLTKLVAKGPGVTETKARLLGYPALASLPFAPATIGSLSDKTKHIINQNINNDHVIDDAVNAIRTKIVDPTVKSVRTKALDAAKHDLLPPMTDAMKRGLLGIGTSAAVGVPAYWLSKFGLGKLLGADKSRPVDPNDPEALDNEYRRRRGRENVAKALAMLISTGAAIPASWWAQANYERLMNTGKRLWPHRAA